MSAIFRRATNLLSLLSDTDYNLAIHIYVYIQREREKKENGVKFVAGQIIAKDINRWKDSSASPCVSGSSRRLDAARTTRSRRV